MNTVEQDIQLSPDGNYFFLQQLEPTQTSAGL